MEKCLFFLAYLSHILDMPHLHTSDTSLTSHSGGDGVLYQWDLRTRRCMGKMVDHGNKDSASLALSRDGRLMATGSASGVVNVYRQNQCWGAGGGGAGGAAAKAGLMRPLAPAPVKEVMNLTTTIDSLRFSPDGQILVGGVGCGGARGKCGPATDTKFSAY